MEGIHSVWAVWTGTHGLFVDLISELSDFDLILVILNRAGRIFRSILSSMVWHSKLPKIINAESQLQTISV